MSAPAATASLPPKPIIGTITGINLQQIIGGGANNPSQSQPGPVTVQAALNASVPREALSGTGITSIEIGTAFPQQSLGAGAAFESETAGTVLNLMNFSKPALAPFNLTLAAAGIGFNAGVYYVLSLNGVNLTSRGSDGTSVSATLPASTNPDTAHTYVGAMVYTTGTTAVPLYPLLQLTLPAPSVGAHGVLQGQTYSVRLTFGDANSLYDILDSTQTVVDSNISVPNPKPADNSTPQPGDLYFGSFIGGASNMTVWAVPVFLTVTPSQLPGAGFSGNMTLSAQASGVAGYQLQITDNSLFVYSNINVDTSAVGSVSSSNVFLASAVINDSPDDQTSKAFAPCKLLMGLIRQAQMGTVLKYVFVPEDDSVIIGGVRYMLSVINLDANDDDPNSRPYPPVFWPQSRYWQFANRHNPYLDVEYTGATQAARISQAQSDIARIGLQTAQAQEPMQMYLDTNSKEMTLWPIYGFPYATATQSIDVGQLKINYEYHSANPGLASRERARGPLRTSGRGADRPPRHSSAVQSLHFRCGDYRRPESHGEQFGSDECRDAVTFRSAVDGSQPQPHCEHFHHRHRRSAKRQDTSESASRRQPGGDQEPVGAARRLAGAYDGSLAFARDVGATVSVHLRFLCLQSGHR